MRARAKRAETEGDADATAGDGQNASQAIGAATSENHAPLAIPASGQAAANGVAQDIVTAGSVPAEAGSGVDNAVSTIKYKQTRVVSLNPQHLEKNRIISFSKTDARTVSFDRLRTQVLRTMRDYGWRTLAVTSPTPHCGKTTVALNLALSIAHQTEQTVVLADFDLRDPQVAPYLGLPESPSLVDYLNGDIPLSEVFVNPGIPRLTILPNHKAILNSAETLMAKKMTDLVSDVRNRYESRMVIFDLPPLLTTDDALAFLPQADCVLLVLANGETTKSQIREAMMLLQGNEVLGTVLNKADEMRGSAG
ncbi:protein tyrosine kinase [Hwanghaeella grinnelliae]|uniref:non-specific protein-tyrosine kinase n=2 Tax=Hwanghaeella grinnelliae TaxID=2500179 RepID=A0A3S2W2P0_9PROT|nr:protein tyrosine kinase [Hwanghaeella grinnelliae]